MVWLSPDLRHDGPAGHGGDQKKLPRVARTSLSGLRVVHELDVRWRGRPDTIVSMSVLRWCQQTGVEGNYIAPASP